MRSVCFLSPFAVCSVLFPFLLTGRGLCEDKPVHLFILSGQSNMAGMNPKVGFEDELAKRFPDAEVPYFKVAQGGQPIRLWVKEWDQIAAKHGLEAKNAAPKYYQPILDEHQKLLAKYPSPTTVTFCWMQGERDAREGLSAAYFDALKQLIDNLRRDLKQPQMGFVIGRLSDFGDASNTHWQAVRKAQVDLATQDPRGAWADCDDLNDKESNGVQRNDLHYTKEGYELLGRRYVRQAQAIIAGQSPAADGRP